MKHLSGNANDFLKEHVVGIIKNHNKYNYREPIKNHFAFMWAMQDVSDEAIKKAKEHRETSKDTNELVMGFGCLSTVAIISIIVQLISSGLTENGLNPKNAFITLIVAFSIIFLAVLYFRRNSRLYKALQYQQVAYYLSVDYLIISEPQKTQRAQIIKMKDISVTKIGDGHLAVYLESLRPVLVYCLNPEEIKNFIDRYSMP